MPAYKPTKPTWSASVSNFPVATTAPGSTSVWGGPNGGTVVWPKPIYGKKGKR